MEEKRDYGEFRVKLYKRNDALEDMEVEDRAVNSYWLETKDALHGLGDEVLGKARRKKKKWLSDRIWNHIEERKDINKRIQKDDLTEEEKINLKRDYREKDAAVKQSVSLDKPQLVDKLAREAEDAAQRHDSRSLFQISKQLSKKPSFANSSLKCLARMECCFHMRLSNKRDGMNISRRS